MKRSIRRLNSNGLDAFRAHVNLKRTDPLDDVILNSDEFSEPLPGHDIEVAEYASRYDFGSALVSAFVSAPIHRVLDESFDDVWNWIAAVFYPQLTRRKVNRVEHYIVTRRGETSNLAYRHSARTAFELVRIHGEAARICLFQPMHRHGQLLESMAASRSIRTNRTLFAVASRLYLVDGRAKSGFGSKPVKAKARKPGDMTGRGSVRRLPMALRRLDLTYDVGSLTAEDATPLLPREFDRWTK